jgi:hypothetical protein
MLEKLSERVHCTAVLEIPNEGDSQVIDSSEFLADGKEIEEGLCRMLETPVT